MSTDPIKDALKRLPYGFYSITSRDGDEVNAMVANWVMQASFTPRIIALGLAKNAYSHGLISKGRAFAVNIFNKADQEAMMPFSKSREKRPDKMDNATYTAAPVTGCPVLEGASAYVECEVTAIIDTGGDHNLVIAEVVGGDILQPGGVTDTLTLPHLGWSYAG